MGCCCAKIDAIEGDDAERYYAGLQMIHNVIRAGMVQIIKHGREGVAADKQDAFRRYVRMFHKILLLHHKDEDDIVFPWIHSKVPGMMDTEATEHKTLHTELDALAAAIGGDDFGAVADITQRIQDLLLPHLAHEETKCDVAFMREHYTNKEVAAHEKELMKAVRAASDDVDLVFIVFHTEVPRRNALALPGFVQNVLFPKWAAKGTELWEFAPHTTYQPGTTKFSFSGK